MQHIADPSLTFICRLDKTSIKQPSKCFELLEWDYKPGNGVLQVYGPHGVGESRLSYFPSIVKAIFQSAGLPGGQAEIQHEIWRVARGIQRAAYLLNGELT